MSRSKDWNPRWVNYCRVVHQAKPDEVDGGPKINGDFMRWLDARWKEWRQTVGRTEPGRMTMEDHVQFDAWLDGLARGRAA